MRKSALLIVSVFLITTPAFAQQSDSCHGVAALPGTTALSCDASPSRVEYQGSGNDTQMALSCLWTVQNNVVIADNRYYMTHAITTRTGEEQITMRADDKIVAIVAQGNGLIRTEVLTPNGVVAKNCATLDIANFTASGCVPAQPSIPPQMIANTDIAMTQDCKTFVQAMASGGSINTGYYNLGAANTRLEGARGFAAGLSR